MKHLYLIVAILLVSALMLAQAPEGMHSRREMMTERQSPEKARYERSQPAMERGLQGMPMLDKLELTDSQKEQIRAFRHAHELTMIDLRAEAAKLQLQKHDQMGKNEYRNAKRTTDQIYNKRAEIEKQRIDLFEKIHQVLTEEQREQMKKMHGDREQMMRKRSHHK